MVDGIEFVQRRFVVVVKETNVKLKVSVVERFKEFRFFYSILERELGSISEKSIYKSPLVANLSAGS